LRVNADGLVARVNRLVRTLLTIASALLAGIAAAHWLGADSPWVWTIALLAGITAGVAFLR
jgi:hypothetical protein